MKFPNMAQAKSFGNFRLGKQDVSDYPKRMERHPVSQIIAQNIERLLKERDISALELANRMKAGRTMVYDILAGRSASPKVSTVADIAAALKVPVSDMFLTEEQVQAQTELLQAYNLLPEAEQRRLAQVVRVWHLD
jgi:transcriptional regulator with XRE-family HTH domain